MHYIDLVKNATNKSEQVMWQSVESVSKLVDELWKNHASMARKFLLREYSRMYGDHFNEELACDTVDDMYHKSNGSIVEGEMVTFQEASSIAPSEEYVWDAYVGVNAFMHDLANEGLGRSEIISAAKSFWFDDVDFSGDSKVFWYFKNQ